MTCSGTGLCTSMGYNSNNQLTSVGGSPLTYDAAGDLMQDNSSVPAHFYKWDAEGRLISIDNGSTASITFNALGQRVYANEPSVFIGTYWRDPSGQFLGGVSSGGWSAEVPFGGRLLADYTAGASGPVYFDHPDALGASQQWTDWAGNSAGEVAFYPWGALWGDTTNGTMFRLFNSLEWYDPPVDGYQADFRYLIPRFGRWLSPDPVAGDVTNPQSLNRYAYVLNNPTSLTDPLGLDIPQGEIAADWLRSCTSDPNCANNQLWGYGWQRGWFMGSASLGGGPWGDLDTDPSDDVCARIDTTDASCGQGNASTLQMPRAGRGRKGVRKEGCQVPFSPCTLSLA